MTDSGAKCSCCIRSGPSELKLPAKRGVGPEDAAGGCALGNALPAQGSRHAVQWFTADEGAEKKTRTAAAVYPQGCGRLGYRAVYPQAVHLRKTGEMTLRNYLTERRSALVSEKAEDQIKEIAGAAQQKYGELTDDYGHQAKVPPGNLPLRAVRRFRMRLMSSASRWVIIR